MTGNVLVPTLMGGHGVGSVVPDVIRDTPIPHRVSAPVDLKIDGCILTGLGRGELRSFWSLGKDVAVQRPRRGNDARGKLAVLAIRPFHQLRQRVEEIAIGDSRVDRVMFGDENL